MNLFERIIERYPELTSAGFVDITDPKYPALRQKLRESTAAWTACVEYLSFYDPSIASTSYGLKHHVQRHAGIYIPQGVAIACCIASGEGRRYKEGLRFD
jgi:hypothetical protein